ncbi:MAG: hypothetical protein A3B68_06205 [Candidatus Melainabacteria bacterium RIFCSPHIGHO2_02_FULL_34_12]|nr:MAG: hypothetical protein A3B68_06205 [Candidatus Melainabacteria bacterium RIFCSPHIGHO2_02_FULL_34_12]
MAEIIEINQLGYKIDFLRKRNKDLKIVATNGCFDILHVGHVRSLQKAKSLGDLLVVGINSDASVKQIKGNNRPITSEKDRAEVLAALECVSIVSIFNEETAEKFLEIVKPDIYVKGEEYDIDNLPEAKTMKKLGGKIIQIPMIPGSSTTDIIEKIKKN